MRGRAGGGACFKTPASHGLRARRHECRRREPVDRPHVIGDGKAALALDAGTRAKRTQSLAGC